MESPTPRSTRHALWSTGCRNSIPQAGRRSGGTVFAHREASMIAAVRALDAALAEPKVTRSGLRRWMLAALAAIAERGPESVQQTKGGN